MALSSTGVEIRCDTCSLAVRVSTSFWRMYWTRLFGESGMAGSRGSGGGRGWRGGVTVKWTMHLSMARGPIETQGALVDGTVHSDVSHAMTLKAGIGVLRMGR